MKQTHQQNVQTVRAVEDILKSRIETLGIKANSKRGMDAQAHFLAGAMAALNATFPSDEPNRLSSACPPRWTISAMTGRSVASLGKYDPPADPAAEWIAAHPEIEHANQTAG